MRFDVISKLCFLHIVCYRCNLIITILMCTLSQKKKEKLFDSNTICLQEVHGKDEFLLAIQVLAPRFRFFGTFILENENAGGSTFSIHRDILLEEAIVTHLVTGHGRDHLVHIQSGRHNLVVVNVQLRRDKIHSDQSGRHARKRI